MKQIPLISLIFFILSLFNGFSQTILKDTITIGEVTITGSKTPQSTGNITQKD